ncbi:MAG: YigZ family protein [Rhizobiaceae bacterium]|nr:YigZ family protein [Rhizobiaceae bacterium]
MAYMTVTRAFSAETEEKKSSFVAHLVPLNAFDATLERLRAEHRKANHHVTAFRRMLENGQIQEIGKDDGEPAGTSGMPVLKTMMGAELMDAAIIVTRYFGGVKLGTGGLARAYSAAANAVIDTAELVPWVQIDRREIEVAFEKISPMEQRITSLGLKVVAREFIETGVVLVVEGAKDGLDELA